MSKNYRSLIVLTMLLTLGVLSGCQSEQRVGSTTVGKDGTSVIYTRTEVISSPLEAEKLLVEGNDRFSVDLPANKIINKQRRQELFSKGQHPFAVIVGCSDSRVPPEVVFDQSLGDLFEVRVAGNVVDSVAVGSVEYAVEHLKAPLIVVMGHEKCGAVTAAVESGTAPGSIGSIVSKISGSVVKAKALGLKGDPLVEKTTELNVASTIAELEKSPIIKELVESGMLKIVGAKYHLESGKVQWLAE